MLSQERPVDYRSGSGNGAKALLHGAKALFIWITAESFGFCRGASDTDRLGFNEIKLVLVCRLI